MPSWILRFYGTLLSSFFAIVFTTQILAFLGIYRSIIALPLMLVVGSCAVYAYFRWDQGWLTQVFPAEIELQTNPHEKAVQRQFILAAVVLIGVVFLLAFVLFPYSRLAERLPSDDATGYHFPKALELLRTGSFWDLAIYYGEYPSGYESLIALVYNLVGSIAPLGIIHALNFSLLLLTLVLLARRYTRLGWGVIAIAFTALFFYPDLYGQVLLLGKNDLFLSMALLAAVLHSPLARRGGSAAFHPFGLAYASLLAMCFKANGVLIPALLWLIVLVYWRQAYREGKATQFLKPQFFVLALGFMSVGGLWVIRNWVMMGRFFSPDTSRFFVGSIAANLTNPQLYTSGNESQTLILLSVWFVAFWILLVFSGRVRWTVALLLAAFWGAFLITPLGAFHTPEKITVHVEWRYTSHTFLLMVVLFMVLAENLIERLYQNWRRLPTVLTGLIVAVGAIGLLIALKPARLFMYNSAHEYILTQPYAQDVGTQGYRSVYDYIHREIHDSTLVFEGGVAFYLYDGSLDNRILSVEPHPLEMPELHPQVIPDAYVYFVKNASTPPRQPQDIYPQTTWEIAYQDEYALLYRRITAP